MSNKGMDRRFVVVVLVMKDDGGVEVYRARCDSLSQSHLYIEEWETVRKRKIAAAAIYDGDQCVFTRIPPKDEI